MLRSVKDNRSMLRNKERFKERKKDYKDVYKDKEIQIERKSEGEILKEKQRAEAWANDQRKKQNKMILSVLLITVAILGILTFMFLI